MKKIITTVIIAIILLSMSACLEHVVNGKAVVEGKNTNQVEDVFTSYIKYDIYGTINGKHAKWQVSETEYNEISVGDTVPLYNKRVLYLD